MTQENELAVTHHQALEEIKKMETPVGKAIIDYINMIEGKNIAILGTDKAFVLRSDDGEIKAFKSALTLSKKDGTLVQPIYEGDFVVSAQGYEVWAEKTGTSVIFPKEIMVGSELQSNPYPVRAGNDPNGRILAVHACAVAFKYSSMGIPQVSSWSTIFDTPSYRMVDLLAKAKQYPQAFRVLPKDSKPKISEEIVETWTCYPYDEAINLWVNTSHNEVIKWLSQIIKREMKSMDFAQTFAKRNALKHLSGIQKAPGNVWTFPVLAWRPTGNNVIKWDSAQYANLQDRVKGMIDGNGADNFQQKIELQKGSERVSEEEGFEALEADVDPEDSPESDSNEEQVKKKDEQKTADESKDLPKDIKQAIFLAGEFPNEYKEACESYGINAMPHQLSPANAIKVCKKVGELVDLKDQ